MAKKPFINWEALAEMTRPKPPQGKPGKEGESQRPGRGIGGWDNQAEFYNRMTVMEEPYTLKQLDLFECNPEDTVLDVCCGPGRIVVPMAQRAKSVTGIDASPKMLKLCEKRAKAAGVDNVETILIDWEDKEAVSKLEKHDIVIASRNMAMFDIETLSSLANKLVVIVIWANNSPSIPQITGELFKGTSPDGDRGPRPHQPDRRLGNNLFYNRIYDAGYNPNVNIIDDGYTATFPDRETAYAELLKLRPAIAEDKIPVFKKNADEFLTDNPDGTVTYLAKTKSAVFWWKPVKEEE